MIKYDLKGKLIAFMPYFTCREECQQAVNGYAGARFKKFGSHEEASSFVGGSDSGSSGGCSSSSYDSYSYSVSILYSVFSE